MISKKKLILGLSMVMALLGSVFSTVALSVAWFATKTDFTPGWNGGSDGAYFAYGNGKQRNQEVERDQPYGITSPRHLYNLAWLQYLGFFNKLDDGSYSTYYFELANDIDMTGWAIPPIGTTDNPFLGNFSGNGHTITGLEISNDLTDFNQKPFGITESDFPNRINILGLFGVVGSYQDGQNGMYDTSANQITNTAISNLVVDSHSTTSLVGLAAGYVNGELSGVAVNDSYLDLTHSGGAAITSITSNISDYSLIGYAKQDRFLDTLTSTSIQMDDPTISNPYVSAGGDEWGGSIPMKEMYTALNAKKERVQKFSASYTSFEEQERSLDIQGNVISDYQMIPSAKVVSTFTEGNTSHNRVYYYDGIDYGTSDAGDSVITGSYTFGSNQNINNIANDNYVGLLGDNLMHQYNYVFQSDTHQDRVGFYLYDTTPGATKNFFTYTGTEVTSTTDKTNASVILFDQLQTGIYALYVYYNNQNYYLNVSGSTLSLSTTRTSSWSIDNETSLWKSGNNYLICVNGTWEITSFPYYSYHFHDGNGTYLGQASDNAYQASDPTNASVWYVDESSQIYSIYNSQRYYFSITRSGNQRYQMNRPTQTNVQDNYYVYKSGDSLCFDISNTHYYFFYDDGFRLDTSAHSWSIDGVDPYSTAIEQADYVMTTYSQQITAYSIYSRETYFPLTWQDGSTLQPSNRNTGYVISGSKYSASDSSSIGDIRLARYYDTTMLKNSSSTSSTTFANNRFFPYSFTQDGTLVKIGDPINNLMNTSGYTPYTSTSLNGTGFKKYYSKLLTRITGSRYTLGNALSADSTAYGLHFMNADIAMNNIIDIPYAKINGREYFGYELPRDAIDFNLKTAGYINFFAATYYSNTTQSSGGRASSKNYANWNSSNNSFFSLHWIDRDGSTISNIQQIAKVYKNTAYDTDDSQPQYVYTFRNDSDTEVTSAYNANSNSLGYHTGIKDDSGNLIVGNKGDLIFDTYWLTDPEYSKFNLDAVYYFEIPVNQGEYALGSTSGKTKTNRGWANQYNKNGAYLIYLDIGASKKNTSAVTINEHSLTTKSTYLFPKGVDFVDLSEVTSIDAFSHVFGGKSGAVTVFAVDANKININYEYTPKINNADALLTVGPESGSGSYQATYKANDTSVQTKTASLISLVSAQSISIDEMDREILYDLTADTNNYIVTEKHKIDGIDQEPVMVTSTRSWSEEQIDAIASFDLENQNLFTLAYSYSSSEAVELLTSYDILTNTYTLNFVSQSGGQEVRAKFLTLNLNQTITGDGETYEREYTIVIQNNSQTITKVNSNSYFNTNLTLTASRKDN